MSDSLWPMDCSTPGFPGLDDLLDLAQTHVHWTHVHWVNYAIQPLILCHPLLHLPSIFPSICVFFSESVLRIRQPKYYSFTISSSCEYSGLISFRIDWFDLFEVQGTLKSLLQTTVKNISSSALSLLYGPTLIPSMTTGKTIALTIWTFVSEVMSLLFNMLSRLVIAFLPGSKRLLIPCLQSPSAVILEPRKIKALAALFPYLFAVKWWDWMPWS